MDDNTVTPYYLAQGEKLLNDLGALGLLRDLSHEEREATIDYIGFLFQEEDATTRRGLARREQARKILDEMEVVKARIANDHPHYSESYSGINLIVPSAPTTGAPYVPTSEVVCRCADNRYCPVHDVQSSYTKDNDFGPHITYHPAPYAISREEDKLLDLTTPDGQAEFQRECEQGLWEIVNHPNFLELIHQSGGWRFNTVWNAGGTDPSIYGIMDVAERVLKGDYDEHR